MRDQLFVIGMCTMLACIGLFGLYITTNVFHPVKSDKVKLLGTWTATINDVTIKLIFFSDDTVSLTYNEIPDSGIYELRDGTLIFTFQSAGRETYDYSFSSDDEELTLQKIGSDIPIIYTKQ